ncbi:MAG: NusG domain II-containing protein [Oscillospiraceae bacterium]|nr:NusG domain II-containing protein [Oscillospiraceae bacterium]
MKDFLKKHWWEPLLLLAAAVLCFLWMRGSFARPGDIARITLSGSVVMEVPLDKSGVYSLKEDPSIRFEIKNGAAAFVDADCPDKICENEGFLSKDGQTAVCLPRRVSLTIVTAGESDEPDMITR